MTECTTEHANWRDYNASYCPECGVRILPDTVLCFDRDLTVDVNPPEQGRAVPLWWVKGWAHHDDSVDVWATGNQHLRSEACIPGMREAKDIWESQRQRSVKGEYPPMTELAPPKYKPSRRDGLRLVADLYAHLERDIELVVVDDEDVSDLEQFTYYEPDTFVQALVDDAVSFGPAPHTVCHEPAQSNACRCTGLTQEVSLQR